MSDTIKFIVKDLGGKDSGEINLSTDVFGQIVRPDILHRVVRWQLAKRQRGTHQTRTIDMISGTTKKPWRQKGTGNARQGSLRSPQFRGGAQIHGPVVRSHEHNLPSKLRKLGLKVALSYKFESGNLIIVDKLALDSFKTQPFNAQLRKLSPTSSLLIDGQVDHNLLLASRNLYDVNVLPQIGANVYDILRHDKLILTLDAVKLLEERL